MHGSAKTTASRCGTLDSGIRVSAQSYDGSIISDLWYCGDNSDSALMLELNVSDDSAGVTDDYTENLYFGTFDKFCELMRICENIKFATDNDDIVHWANMLIDLIRA